MIFLEVTQQLLDTYALHENKECHGTDDPVTCVLKINIMHRKTDSIFAAVFSDFNEMERY